MRRNRGGRLPHLRDQRRRHAACGSSPSAPGVTDIDPIYLPDGRDPLHLDARAEVLHVQPAHHGQPVHDGRRRREHPPDRPQHAARRARRRCCPTAACSTTAGNTWTATSATPRACGPCNPDGTNHAVYWGNNTASPGAVLDARADPRHASRSSATFSLVPRPAVGRAGDRRPAAAALDGRAAGGAHLAGRRDRPGRHSGNYDTFTRRPAEVRRPLSAHRQVLPLLADDRPGRADGHLPARRVRQRDAAARRRRRAASTRCRWRRGRGRRSFPSRHRPGAERRHVSTWPTSTRARDMERRRSAAR